MLCRWCCAFALPLPCLCPVFAVSLSCLAWVLPCHGRGAVPLPWFCRVVALLLQCLCRVFVVSCPVLTMSWPWSGAFVPWLCRVVAVFCNVFAVFLPCGCRAAAFAVTVSLLRACSYYVFAVAVCKHFARVLLRIGNVNSIGAFTNCKLCKSSDHWQTQMFESITR